MERIETVPANVTVAHLYTTLDKVMILGFVPLVTCIGLLGNGTLLYTFYRNQSMRTSTNIYLGNLAVADGTLLLSGTLQWLWTYASSPIYYNYAFSFSSQFGCAFPDFLVYLSYFASVFLVCVLTLERYLAVCKPLKKYQSQGKKTRAVVMCALAWVCATIMAAFRFPQWPATFCLNWPEDAEFADYPKVVELCSESVYWSLQITYYSDIVQFLLAFTLVCFASIAMVVTLKKRLTKTLTDDGVSREQFHRDANRITYMLITNATIFFLCLAPFEILNIEGLFAELGLPRISYEVSTVIAWIGRVTMHLNSAINPIIYSIVHERYRRAFYEAWRRKKPKRKLCYQSTFSSYISSLRGSERVRNGSGGNYSVRKLKEDTV